MKYNNSQAFERTLLEESALAPGSEFLRLRTKPGLVSHAERKTVPTHSAGIADCQPDPIASGGAGSSNTD